MVVGGAKEIEVDGAEVNVGAGVDVVVVGGAKEIGAEEGAARRDVSPMVGVLNKGAGTAGSFSTDADLPSCGKTKK